MSVVRGVAGELGGAALAVRALGKSFGEKCAVSGLTFEVAEGEVFGLLGPNGAGKTTTLRMLAGLLEPDEGEATVAGLDVRTAPAAVRAKVGLLTEQPGLYDRLTAEENLTFYGRLYGVPARELPGRIERLLRSLGVFEARKQRAGVLSKGMRQKVSIARALLHEPRVIFLDEPTGGLDPEAARTVRESISALAAEGRTLVLCSHNLFEVERLCRRVAILRPSAGGGRLVALTEVDRLRARSPTVDIEVEGLAAPFLAALDGLVGLEGVTQLGGRLELGLGPEGAAVIPEAITRLVAAGARIRAVVPRERGLEAAYLSLAAAEEGGS